MFYKCKLVDSFYDCIYHNLILYLFCPRFWEAHVCKCVQGRQTLSVDLGWGWIFSRWKQCGHIAVQILASGWINGFGLDSTFWDLCHYVISHFTVLTVCLCGLLFLIIEKLYLWVEERRESDLSWLRVEQTQTQVRRELRWVHPLVTRLLHS